MLERRTKVRMALWRERVGSGDGDGNGGGDDDDDDIIHKVS